MSRRNKIIIFSVIALVLILLIVIIVWYFLKTPQPSPTPIDNQPTFGGLPQRLPVIENDVVGQNNSIEVVPIQDQKVESTIKAIARTFAERFGSYSNQGEFENLADLKDLMTVKMRGWTDSYITSQRVEQANAVSYYGVTTIALSVSVISFDESLGRADVLVAAQRQEARGDTTNPQLSYQNLLLKMVKTGDGWKIDEAIWQ